MITLEPHQINAIQKGPALLRKHRILYLRFWMRKGKSLTALHICNECLANTSDAAVLFVTEKEPIKSVQSDFDNEMVNPCFKLTVINYESVHKVMLQKFNIIILDEVHRLSTYPKPNTYTKRVKDVCQNKPIIYLTATPTPESFSQFYHQFWVSSYTPFGKWYNFYRWAEDFVDVYMEKYKGVPHKVYDKGNINKIWPHISHLFITVKPDEGGKACKIVEHILEVPMSAKCIEITTALKKEKIYINEKGQAAIANSGGELDNKLGQISSGTLKFGDDPRGCIYEDGEIIDTSKAEFIRSYFSDKKIAIFYRFVAEGRMLRMFFPNHTDDYMEFNTRNDQVFIMQIRSARVGIKLDTADALVMFNIEWSALSYIQGMARHQSMTRGRDADVYWIFSKHGIERKIYNDLKTEKSKMTDFHYA